MSEKYPKIYLAMDNCALYKRFTQPDEWAGVIKGLGISYIEASCDTELDPLYMGKEYLEKWAEDVQKAEKAHGVKVCNLYSGHGSYTTTGMAHDDEHARKNMTENFFFPLMDIAGRLDCGVGFFAHAFRHEALNSFEDYKEKVNVLTGELAKVSRYAKSAGAGKIGIERMYTPHQYPWRNRDIEELLTNVKSITGNDFYFTEDVGHHHTRFLRPTEAEIEIFRAEGKKRGLWLGTDRAYCLFDAGADIKEITEEMDKNPHLFSKPCDNDPYEALRLHGCFSPIIHLQQTNGTTSAHLPFTAEENAKGIIDPKRILTSIKESYEAHISPIPIQKCDKIYLTLEIFSSTTSIIRDVLKDIKESADYFRKYIPEDGIPLDELV